MRQNVTNSEIRVRATTAVRRQDILSHQSICLATSIQKDFRLLTKIIVTPTPNDNGDDVVDNDCKNSINQK